MTALFRRFVCANSCRNSVVSFLASVDGPVSFLVQSSIQSLDVVLTYVFQLLSISSALNT